MKSLHKTYETTASKTQVWNALTNENIMTSWSGAPAKMEAKNGGKFELWEARIYGTNKKIDDDEIQQSWYAEGWKTPSDVTFSIQERNEKTLIELQHDGIPDDAIDNISKGWDEYYMGPMIDYLESTK